MNQIKKYRIIITIILTISVVFFGCNNKKNSENAQDGIDEISGNAYIESSFPDLISDGGIPLSLDSERDESTSNTDNIDEYLSTLWNYILNNKDVSCLIDKNTDVIATVKNRNRILNLIRYDGNQFELGTLERTWTFLQIINNDVIEAYRLFEKSAEYPLFIKAIEIENSHLIISVAGVTNVSRMHTAFISFWRYDSKGITKYEDISIDSDKGKLFSNEYYVESFDENGVKIIDTNNELSFFEINSDSLRVNVILQNEKIIINTVALN